MCRRCVWDIFGLGVHRRMLADCLALFGDISPMAFGVETSGENLNACIEILSRCPDPLARHGDYSRTSPIIRQTTGAWWRGPGDA